MRLDTESRTGDRDTDRDVRKDLSKMSRKGKCAMSQVALEEGPCDPLQLPSTSPTHPPDCCGTARAGATGMN